MRKFLKLSCCTRPTDLVQFSFELYNIIIFWYTIGKYACILFWLFPAIFLKHDHPAQSSYVREIYRWTTDTFSPHAPRHRTPQGPRVCEAAGTGQAEAAAACREARAHTPPPPTLAIVRSARFGKNRICPWMDYRGCCQWGVWGDSPIYLGAVGLNELALIPVLNRLGN